MEHTTQFIADAIEGNVGSLGWVVSRYQPIVEAHVRFRLGSAANNEADVQDLASDVWVTVLPKLASLRRRDGRLANVLGSYLGTVTLRKCNHFLASSIRRLRRLGSGESENSAATGFQDLVATTRGVVTRVAQVEECEIIRAEIEGMPATQREVLVLRLLEHRSNREIADLLGVPDNTAAVRYRRALRSLREKLPRSLFRELMDLRGRGPLVHEGDTERGSHASS